MRYVLLLLAGLCLVSCSAGKSGNAGIRDAEYYYSLAINSYYDKNAQVALRELAACFAINPDHVKAHNLAGLVYLGRKEYADSLHHLKRTLELAPNFLDASANLGALYMAMHNWRKAIEVLAPLARDPLYATPYLVENNLGWAYFKLGKNAEAETHLKRALFLNDKMCLAYNNLGVVQVEQESYDDALDNFEAAIKRCPQFVEPYFRAGTVLERNSDFKDAQKKFKKCSKMGGDSVFGRRCRRKLQAMK